VVRDMLCGESARERASVMMKRQRQRASVRASQEMREMNDGVTRQQA